MQNTFHYTFVLVIEQHFISIKMLLVSRKTIKIFVEFFIFLLSFRIHDRDPRYYADGEDAYSMRRDLAPLSKTPNEKK